MKKYLLRPIISISPESYITLIIFLAPFANFLGGISTDLYSPSLPAVMSYFHSGMAAAKNTISIFLFGWAIGAIFFGVMIDTFGRKKILLSGLLIYFLASIFAPFSDTIHGLMFARLLQGFSVASITVGVRVLVIDVVKGKRFLSTMLYISMGYSLGPIAGPFVGGLFQHYFGWKSNFILLALVSFSILIVLILFLKETIEVRHPLKINNIAKRYYSVISHQTYLIGVILGGLGQIEIMLYPTLGPFIVERELHQTAIVYGNSALMVGACYFLGSLIGRALLKYLQPKAICDIGFCLQFTAILIGILFAKLLPMELTTVMLPVSLLCIGVGVYMPTLLGYNIKQFSHIPGIAMAVQVSCLSIVAAIGIFLVSHIDVKTLSMMAIVLSILFCIAIPLFFGVYRKAFDEKSE